MIFVDTSVWVTAARAPAGREASSLHSLLDADEVNLPLPVRIELLAGAARKNRQALKVALSALPLSIPGEDTWQIVNQWIEPAANAGYRFGVADLLLAAMAREHGGLVWSLDSDFHAMEKLGMVGLY